MIRFSRFQSPDRLTKRMKLDADGSLLKEQGGQMQSGSVVKVYVSDMADFVRELAATGHQHRTAFGYGVCLHDQANVTVKHKRDNARKRNPQKPVVARAQDDFMWPDGRGIMMIDYDPPEDAEPYGRDDLIALIRKIVPELSDTEFVWWASSSSFIYNAETGTEHKGLSGQRLYFAVENASDIPRAGNMLFARLWDTGHGYIQISKAGSMLVRAPVDAAVWQPERLDFVAGAFCDPPLEQRRGDPVLFPGTHAALDSKTALPDDPQLWARYEQAVEDAKQDRKPDAQKVRERYVADRVSRGDGERASVEAAIDGGRLPNDWSLTLADGSAVKVRDVLASPEHYHGKHCLDPLEPDYDHGRIVGKIYTNGRAPTVWSYARGGRTFFLGDTTAWMAKLRVNDSGVIIKDAANVRIALREAPELDGVVAYNDFNGKLEALRPVPEWGAAVPKPDHTFPRNWEDADDVALQLWLQSACLPGLARGTVSDVVLKVARENAYHPIRNYLNSLHWDGHERLSRWLIDYCGAADDEYTRAVGRAWLISAVARAMKPGCKADCMLVLEGPQGSGKSTALQVLAGTWFSDSLPRDVGHKDAKDHLRGSWIIEIGELASVKRSEVEELKMFLAARVDRFRPAYQRYEVEWYRQCVFAGTTNEDRYLKDPTGNRRHWPVLCGDIDLDGLRAVRGQMWAEAVAAYRKGERWWLDTGTEAKAKDAQDARREDDAWETAISDHLEVVRESRVTTRAVGKAALGLTDKELTNPVTQRIGRILSELGCERRKVGRTRWYYLPEDSGENSGAVASLDDERRRRFEDAPTEDDERRRREAENPM